MKLFLINGYAGSGKDEFVKFVTEVTSNDGVLIANIHSSDRAKAALKSLNWSGAKTKESRRLLADLCDFGQARGVSVELIEKEMHNTDVIFFHERNPEQIQYLKEVFPNSTSIWVYSPRGDKAAEEDRWGMETLDYDITIFNGGSLEDLRQTASEFVNHIGGQK